MGALGHAFCCASGPFFAAFCGVVAAPSAAAGALASAAEQGRAAPRQRRLAGAAGAGQGRSCQLSSAFASRRLCFGQLAFSGVLSVSGLFFFSAFCRVVAAPSAAAAGQGRAAPGQRRLAGAAGAGQGRLGAVAGTLMVGIIGRLLEWARPVVFWSGLGPFCGRPRHSGGRGRGGTLDWARPVVGGCACGAARRVAVEHKP